MVIGREKLTPQDGAICTITPYSPRNPQTADNKQNKPSEDRRYWPKSMTQEKMAQSNTFLLLLCSHSQTDLASVMIYLFFSHEYAQEIDLHGLLHLHKRCFSTTVISLDIKQLLPE
jgi:hypothetical protein